MNKFYRTGQSTMLYVIALILWNDMQYDDALYILFFVMLLLGYAVATLGILSDYKKQGE